MDSIIVRLDEYYYPENCSSEQAKMLVDRVIKSEYIKARREGKILELMFPNSNFNLGWLKAFFDAVGELDPMMRDHMKLTVPNTELGEIIKMYGGQYVK